LSSAGKALQPAPPSETALASESGEGRMQVAQAPAAQTGASQPRPSGPAPAVATPQPQTAQPLPPGRQPAQLDRNNLLFLVRTVLLALHHANETGNYSVVREMSAPGFQAANNQARLAEIFANLRAQKLDLSAVAVLDPQLSSVPSLDANGHLLIEGAYPQIPPHVSFQLLFAPVEGKWRLQGIGINLGPPAAVLGQSTGQPAPAPPTPSGQAAQGAPQQLPARPAAAPAARPSPPRPATPQPRRTPTPAEPPEE
jgi:hypothetical protein